MKVRVALAASWLVLPVGVRAQSRYRNECPDRIQQVEAGRPSAGALSKLVECGLAGTAALGRQLRAAASGSDTIRLAELRQTLFLVRDSSLLRTALAVATDSLASPEGRITALFVAVAQYDSLIGLRPGAGFAAILADSLETPCQLTVDRRRPNFRWTTPLPPATPWLVSTAANAGVVRDTLGRPLPSADVLGLTSRMRTRTDGSGRFLLNDLGPGPELFLVRSIGFRPERFPTTLTAGDTMSVEIVLGSSPQQMPELTVQAFGREYHGKMAQYAREMLRSAAAAASFIGPEQIEAWGRFDLANVFRRAGLRVENNKISCPVNGSITRPIDIDVYLDDALVSFGPDFDVSSFPVQWIEAAMVFKRIGQAPIWYQRMGAGCVVLLLGKY